MTIERDETNAIFRGEWCDESDHIEEECYRCGASITDPDDPRST